MGRIRALKSHIWEYEIREGSYPVLVIFSGFTSKTYKVTSGPGITFWLGPVWLKIK